MYSINTSDCGCKYDIMRCLFSLIKTENMPPVIMCIGSAAKQGDNLGPLVGDLLINSHNIRTYVYGCRQRPLTANNVIAAYNFIRKTHKEKIITIDAAAGGEGEIVAVFKGGISPGAATNKNMPQIGDYSVICNINAYFNQTVSTPPQRQNALNKIAENIACAVSDALILYGACKLS